MLDKQATGNEPAYKVFGEIGNVKMRIVFFRIAQAGLVACIAVFAIALREYWQDGGQDIDRTVAILWWLERASIGLVITLFMYLALLKWPAKPARNNVPKVERRDFLGMWLDLPLHERVYNRAYEKSKVGEPVSFAEDVTLKAYSLHIYVDGDGMDNGIGNMDPERARFALRSLRVLGLESLATELDRFITYFEVTGQREQSPEETAAYFQFCDRTREKIRTLGFDDIPKTLDKYLLENGEH